MTVFRNHETGGGLYFNCFTTLFNIYILFWGFGCVYCLFPRQACRALLAFMSLKRYVASFPLEIHHLFGPAIAKSPSYFQWATHFSQVVLSRSSRSVIFNAPPAVSWPLDLQRISCNLVSVSAQTAATAVRTQGDIVHMGSVALSS